MIGSVFVHKYLLFVVLVSVIIIRIYPKLEPYMANSYIEAPINPPFFSITFFIYFYIYFNIYYMYCNFWLLFIDVLGIIIDTIFSYCWYVFIYRLTMMLECNY